MGYAWRAASLALGVKCDQRPGVAGRMGALASSANVGPAIAIEHPPARRDDNPGVRGSLCGLHPESLRDRGELVADLLNAGGELARAAQIHDLAGLRQPACNRRIGL